VIQQSLGQQVSQPVAQIVAGFAKVFVGEIVEKGTTSVSDLHIQANILQHGRYKNAEETVALYHQTIYEKHTGCIKNKLDGLEPPGHCVQNDCLSGEMLSFHFGALSLW
jgi:hypothetical protein